MEDEEKRRKALEIYQNMVDALAGEDDIMALWRNILLTVSRLYLFRTATPSGRIVYDFLHLGQRQRCTHISMP